MDQLLESAFASRRVLVTGNTGFKGSWLCLWLSRLGARVSGYALAPGTTPNLYESAGVQSLLANDLRADVRDAKEMRRAVKELEPEVVFHLAAQPLVLAGYREPSETFDTNVMGTVNLLKAIRVSGRPSVVIVVTSDKCYANREVVWGYREDDPLGGADPYSASKAAAEIVAAAYAHSFFDGPKLEHHGIRMATVRAGNVIGGGDWAPNRLIPDIVRSLAAKERIKIRNPAAVRPWQHVLEPLAGYLILAASLLGPEHAKLHGAWNFGPRSGDENSVRHVVRDFCAAWGDGEWDEMPDPNAPHEAGILRLSIDRAVTLLPWKPRWSTDEVIVRTASWYRAHARDAGFSAREACARDIEAYSRRPGT